MFDTGTKGPGSFTWELTPSSISRLLLFSRCQHKGGTSSLTCCFISVTRVNSEYQYRPYKKAQFLPLPLPGQNLRMKRKPTVLQGNRSEKIKFQHYIFQRKEQLESSRKSQQELHQGDLNHGIFIKTHGKRVLHESS